MTVAIVTGSGGLVGSEAVSFFAAQGLDVVGIDNDMRARFFGEAASTAWNVQRLQREIPGYRHESIDIRDPDGVSRVFARYGEHVGLVLHTAAQPSHDWARQEPTIDFTINANGTLALLEALRAHCPQAVFLFTSTNKVYGDLPNRLPLVELDTRWEVEPSHPFAEHGINESMSIDASMHSLFGVSKLAADVLVQEYGRTFGSKTGTFRAGCVTGPAHRAVELHGFLAYLLSCTLRGEPYTVFGYGGKQVRDNIHARDVVEALWQFYRAPRPGEVYNLGGSRHCNLSMLEAIEAIQHKTGRRLDYSLRDEPRAGDHIWYVSDVRKLREHYPAWQYSYDCDRMLDEMVEAAKR